MGINLHILHPLASPLIPHSTGHTSVRTPVCASLPRFDLWPLSSGLSRLDPWSNPFPPSRFSPPCIGGQNLSLEPLPVWEVASFLDGQGPLYFWYRNVPHRGYYVQGWQKSRIYADFIFTTTGGDKKDNR